MDDKTPQLKQTFQSGDTEFKYDTMLSNKNMYDGIVDEPLAYINWSLDAAKPNSSDWTSLAYLDEMIAAYSIVAAEPMLGDLVFYHDGKEYVRIKANGKVFLGEGVASDEASRLFWEQVENFGMQLSAPETENPTTTYSPALDQIVKSVTQPLVTPYYQDILTGKAFVLPTEQQQSVDAQDDQDKHIKNYERAMKVVR